MNIHTTNDCKYSNNPSQCTAATTTTCGNGGTQVGSKCFTFNAGVQTWLAAMTTCLAAGEIEPSIRGWNEGKPNFKVAFMVF